MCPGLELFCPPAMALHNWNGLGNLCLWLELGGFLYSTAVQKLALLLWQSDEGTSERIK